MIENYYILNPNKYLIPDYKLSPFNNNYIIYNSDENYINQWNNYVSNRWRNVEVCITQNGSEAIRYALSQLNLKRDDIVSILTPSNNFYVSGCVTKEIEKFCKWNREINSCTKVIFLIHEFGKVFEDVEFFKKYGLPIIEDCAYSFTSQNVNQTVGQVGDYVIYSFPKFFPIQIGGLLISKKKLSSIVSEDIEVLIKSRIGEFVFEIQNFNRKRVENHEYLSIAFQKIGLYSRFEFSDHEIPGVFMFKMPDNLDLNDMKKYFYSHGIESSVFYGEQAYFIPCHHNLKRIELDYFIEIVKSYINGK